MISVTKNKIAIKQLYIFSIKSKSHKKLPSGTETVYYHSYSFVHPVHPLTIFHLHPVHNRLHGKADFRKFSLCLLSESLMALFSRLYSLYR
jgi:hypothetical protein